VLKTLGSLAAATLLATSLVASEGHEDSHVEGVAEHAPHHKEYVAYVVVKGLMTFGDSVTHEKEGGHGEHEEVTLDGDQGAGIGIDIGVPIAYGFNIEFDFSYAKADVTEKPKEGEGEKETGTGEFFTYALDLVYAYHVTHDFVVFGKGGWEYEVEKIDDFHIDSDDNGFVYGIGVEYSFTHQVGLVAEYENSTIEGPRGAGVFLGVIVGF
jgi:opacity protein-like surface antigen